MSITYAQYITSIASIASYESETSPDFVEILPRVIEYAENRICRDLDLLTTVYRDSTNATVPFSRFFTIPSSVVTFITVQSMNVIMPVGETNTESGPRVPLANVTRDYLDLVWPWVTGAGVPQYFAPLDDRTMVLGPWPNGAYQVEVIGTGRPEPLAATNPSTFISRVLPDIFIAASMVFMSGFQRNFGAQADDPKMASSWEQTYTTLVSGAAGEEARRKYLGAAGTAYSGH